MDNLQQELKSVARPDEVEGLVSMAMRLEQAKDVPQRSRSAHIAGRDSLHDRITTSGRSWPQQWVWPALVPTAVFALLVVTVLFAQIAMPGQPLYALKRTSESARLSVTFGATNKAEMCSIFMKRRANELANISSTNLTSKQVASLTTSISDEAEEFNEYLLISSDAKTLTLQRSRDAQYVVSALQQVNTTKLDSRSKQILQATIAEMQALVKLS